MTFTQAAGGLRRLADAFDKVGGDQDMLRPQPMLHGDFAAGAILHLLYLRDLFTATEKTQFNREEILVLIDTAGHDPETFPAGTWELVEKCLDDNSDV